MMADMMDHKPTFHSDYQEFEARDEGIEKRQKTVRLLESVRFAFTLLALLVGLTILGTSADTLSVYNRTRLGPEFYISLWPTDFNIQPTVALVVCSCIIFLASAVNLIVMKNQSVRSRPLIDATISFAAPAVCLIAALIGTSFFYGVNASDTVSSLKSWSCQWSDISMNVQPYWGQLCKESKVALYLTVMIIPVEVIVLSTAAFASFSGKKHFIATERKGSPAMS